MGEQHGKCIPGSVLYTKARAKGIEHRPGKNPGRGAESKKGAERQSHMSGACMHRQVYTGRAGQERMMPPAWLQNCDGQTV